MAGMSIVFREVKAHEIGAKPIEPPSEASQAHAHAAVAERVHPGLAQADATEIMFFWSKVKGWIEPPGGIFGGGGTCCIFGIRN